MKRIAIFASGSGSNFEAIVSACERGEIVGAEIALMVCDKPSAKVVERAKQHNVDAFIFNPKDYDSRANFEAVIVAELDRRGIDLVCLAGYMRIVGEVFLSAYAGRIINIHPSLLPAFKGATAIKDAFEYGVKVYGVSIHYVNEALDGGKIIAQRAIPYQGDSMEELEAMVHTVEHSLYVETINKLIK